jgi:hypothetical protein
VSFHLQVLSPEVNSSLSSGLSGKLIAVIVV